MSISGDVGQIGLHGAIGILNVGDGDTKLSFDPKNPAERCRAAKIITDMLRLGFAIMIEDPPGSKSWVRVRQFREDTCEYLIADVDDEQREKEHQREDADEPSTETAIGTARAEGGEAASTPIPDSHPVRRGRRARKLKPVAAERTRAIGVARSAGG